MKGRQDNLDVYPRYVKRLDISYSRGDWKWLVEHEKAGRLKCWSIEFRDNGYRLCMTQYEKLDEPPGSEPLDIRENCVKASLAALAPPPKPPPPRPPDPPAKPLKGVQTNLFDLAPDSQFD